MRQATLCLFQTCPPTHDLFQKAVTEGPGHRLSIAVPKAVAPARGWPILHMPDGYAAFDDFLTPDYLAMALELIVVGAGYATDRQLARAANAGFHRAEGSRVTAYAPTMSTRTAWRGRRPNRLSPPSCSSSRPRDAIPATGRGCMYCPAVSISRP